MRGLRRGTWIIFVPIWYMTKIKMGCQIIKKPVQTMNRIFGQCTGATVSPLEGLLSPIAPSGVCGRYWKNVRTMAHVKLPGVG